MSTFRELIENISPEKRRLGHYLSDLLVSIEETMEGKGVTQKELADRLGMQPPQLSRLLSDIRNYHGNPTLETIARISTALDTEMLSFPVFEEWSRRTFGDDDYKILVDTSGERAEHAPYIDVDLKGHELANVPEYCADAVVVWNAENQGIISRKAA